jgi:hypothetical protein
MRPQSLKSASMHVLKLRSGNHCFIITHLATFNTLLDDIRSINSPFGYIDPSIQSSPSIRSAKMGLEATMIV